MTVLDNPVRRQLYELVADVGEPVSRDAAAASVGVGRSLAAYHLDKLVECGLLEAGFARERERGGPGAGRPPKLYRRARREFALRLPPRDYQVLGELLVRAAGSDPSGGVRTTLERAAHELGRSLGETGGDPDDLEALLRLRGYEPVAGESGTLRLRNCPFHGVASLDPELVCGLNLRLLQGLIEGLNIKARARLQPREGHCCVEIALR